jgi:hypothetical protein
MDKEFKNNMVHIVIGIGVSWSSTLIYFLLSTSFLPALGIFLSAGIGLTIEVCQYFYNDNKELKIIDRLLDWAGYIVGGLTILLYA